MEKPFPWAYCDRCGMRYLHQDLEYQFDFRGNKLANLRILVCRRTCIDVPQDQLRVVVIGPDPIPVVNARPGFQATQQGYTPIFSILEIVDGDLEPPLPPNALGNDGGVLFLDGPNNWPTSALPPGCYNNGGACSVSLPTVPTPGAPLVIWNTVGVTAAYILGLGGDAFPTTDPHVLDAIWNNGGLLCVSFG